MTSCKQFLLVVALELFFVYDELGTIHSIWQMVKQHQTIFEVWNIIGGQIDKFHMGWRLGCKIFCGQFNQDVIWKGDPWHVWAEFRGTN